MAPEMIKGEEYSNKVDVWSIGILTYIVLCGVPPFDSEDEDELKVHSILHDSPWEFP